MPEAQVSPVIVTGALAATPPFRRHGRTFRAGSALQRVRNRSNEVQRPAFSLPQYYTGGCLTLDWLHVRHLTRNTRRPPSRGLWGRAGTETRTDRTHSTSRDHRADAGLGSQTRSPPPSTQSEDRFRAGGIRLSRWPSGRFRCYAGSMVAGIGCRPGGEAPGTLRGG